MKNAAISNLRFSHFVPSARFATTLGLIAVVASSLSVFGQVTTSSIGNAPGVYIDVDGTLKRRDIDDRQELAGMRARVQAAQTGAKNEKLAFVSLPASMATARAAIDAGRPIPDDTKYLGGLTQIRYLFLYPETNDLVVAGPAEPVQVIDELHARGKQTGRPVMRLEDFVVAMRVVKDARQDAFGCRIDPDPAAPGRVHQAMQELARATRAERVKAAAKAIGPQKVSFFGRVPDDTRFAFIMLAADYELKRFALGLANTTVPDLGNTIDNTRRAVNMVWYELAYDPILVSPDGNAYGFRGPRLKVEAGSFDWDPKGATPTAFRFATKMTRNIPLLAINEPLIAELQNLADWSVVSALIQRDRLGEKVGWEIASLRDTGRGAAAYPLMHVTVAKTAEPLSTYTNGSIAGGGVVLAPAKLLAMPFEKDQKQVLEPIRQQVTRPHAEKPAGTSDAK